MKRNVAASSSRGRNFIQGFGGKQPAVHSDGAQQHRGVDGRSPQNSPTLVHEICRVVRGGRLHDILSNGIFDVYFYWQDASIR